MTNAFANQISNRNFLSPIGFKFTISKNPKIAFFCNSAKIPDITLSTETQSTYLKDIDVPGDKISYGDFSIKFLVDEDFVNYSAIHNWITGLGFPETAQQYKNLITDDAGNQDSLKGFSDGSLSILDSNFNTNIVIKFKDLYPISLSALEFDSTKSDIQYFTTEAVFKYTIYNILDKNNKPL
jgi:hypothetical protein